MRRIIFVILCIFLLATTVSATGTVRELTSTTQVDSDGSCQVSLTMQIAMDTADDDLVFPLPRTARDVSLNGHAVRSPLRSGYRIVDLSDVVPGAGIYTVTIQYSLPDSVILDDKDQLFLQFDLLSGFICPIEKMHFTVTLPGTPESRPSFTSTYYQETADSLMDLTVEGNTISATVTSTLKDQETLTMSLAVSEEMFPQSVAKKWKMGTDDVMMLGLAVLALAYWLLTMRCLPPRRSRKAQEPEGLTAGELGSCLTGQGVDFTMLVVSWAQMGYLLIQLDDNGRVLLHKRMDMGNERNAFERKVFKLLFGRRRIIDATGAAYAKLCRKVATYVPSEKNAGKSLGLKRRLYRLICCASHVFCGICVAMNMTGIAILQILLSIALGLLAAVTAWLIQEVPFRTHLRGKVPVYIGGVCVLIWIVLGLIAGQVWIPLGSSLGQLILGYFAAYGGRRTDVARQDACMILGLRHYLKTVKKEELDRIQSYDPEFFFHMAPCALALGVIKPFAKNFDNRRLEQCPYIMTRVQGRRTAAEWAMLMSEVADAMDERHRQMMVERWNPIHIR